MVRYFTSHIHKHKNAFIWCIFLHSFIVLSFFHLNTNVAKTTNTIGITKNYMLANITLKIEKSIEQKLHRTQLTQNERLKRPNPQQLIFPYIFTKCFLHIHCIAKILEFRCSNSIPITSMDSCVFTQAFRHADYFYKHL